MNNTMTDWRRWAEYLGDNTTAIDLYCIPCKSPVNLPYFQLIGSCSHPEGDTPPGTMNPP